MEPKQLRELLDAVRAGRLDVSAALAQLQAAPVMDLGYAHLDLQRRERCGFPEVIFCQGKASDWVVGVIRQLAAAGQDCLATRVSPEQADHLAREFPLGDQDRVARTFWLPAGQCPEPV